ncbi:MAG: tripartite tricarboxylate transporter TctB family protein [Betaproteobacteria bacterium]
MTESQRPQGGLRSDQVSGLILSALALYVGWLNREFPVGTLAEPGPGYVPMLLAIGLGLIGLLIAVLGSRSSALSGMVWPEAIRALVIMTACVLATLALERIGYRITVAALLVFFFGVVERKSWWMTATVAVAFSLASHSVVGVLLKVPLPRGPWGF